MKTKIFITILLILSAVGTYSLIKHGNDLESEIAYTYSNVSNYHTAIRWTAKERKELKEYSDRTIEEFKKLSEELKKSQ